MSSSEPQLLLPRATFAHSRRTSQLLLNRALPTFAPKRILPFPHPPTLPTHQLPFLVHLQIGVTNICRRQTSSQIVHSAASKSFIWPPPTSQIIHSAASNDPPHQYYRPQHCGAAPHKGPNPKTLPRRGHLCTCHKSDHSTCATSQKAPYRRQLRDPAKTKSPSTAPHTGWPPRRNARVGA